MMWKRRDFLRASALAGAGWFVASRVGHAVAADLPPLRIVHYTDVHCMPGLTNTDLLARAAEKISAMHGDVVIASGDVIHEGHVSRVEDCVPRFEMYRGFLGALPPGVEHCVGNHDLAGARPRDGSAPAADPWQLWRGQLGCVSANRTFERAGYKFLVFDTLRVLPEGLVYDATPSAASLAWLDTEIAATPAAQPVILCTHVPFLSEFALGKAPPGEPPPVSLQVPGAAGIVARFRDKRLVAVLQGHVHVKERMSLSGVPVLTGGAISGAWWKGTNQGTPPGFASIEIRDGHLAWSYHALDA